MFRKILFLLSVFCTSLLNAQTDTGKSFHTGMIKVNNNIYMLQGKGGNIGLSFGKDGIFMVDSQYEDGIELIKKEINKKSNDSIVFLINTHFHQDHTGGNAALAETGTIIVAHELTKKRLESTMEAGNKKKSPLSLPVITFSKDLTFDFNNERILLMHVPTAHTDGDVMVYFTDNNVLHMGDIFFHGKYPFIDLKHGGSVKGYIAAMETALNTIDDNTKIIPGHGPLATVKDLRNDLTMLASTYKQVQQMVAKGKTEDEVVAMTNLTDTYDAQGYGDGFINRESFLRTLYADLSQVNESKQERREKNEAARKKYEQIKKQHEKKG